MNDDSLLELLRENRFLDHVDDRYLEQIAAISAACDFDDGQTVFREGEAAKHVHLVVFGTVSLEICASGAGCKRILTVGAGEVLGWSALLEHSRFAATARTLTRTQLIKIDAAQLLTLCEHNPRFGYIFMRRTVFALGARLNAAFIQLVDVYGSQLPAAMPAPEASHGK